MKEGKGKQIRRSREVSPAPLNISSSITSALRSRSRTVQEGTPSASVSTTDPRLLPSIEPSDDDDHYHEALGTPADTDRKPPAIMPPPNNDIEAPDLSHPTIVAAIQAAVQQGIQAGLAQAAATPPPAIASNDKAIQAAVRQALAAQASLSPSPADVSRRALTADLQSDAHTYIPDVSNPTPAIAKHKIRFPKTQFANHNGEVEYDSWKMEMKLCLEDYSGNFIDRKE